MISVITITHNRIDFLSKAIRSVLEQNFHDFEHIVVDDGSNEPIEDLVKGFDDSRIKYVYTERVGQIASLRNIGLDHAKGEIISFLDNDDLWEPSYLSKVNTLFEKNDTLSVVSNAVIVTEKINTILFNDLASLKTSGNLMEQKLLNDKFVIYPSCFSMRKSDLRFNKEFKFGDNDLVLRILASGNSVILPDALVRITKHGQNVSLSAGYNSPSIQSYLEELRTLLFLKDSKKISQGIYRRSASKYYYKLALNLLQLKMKHEARANFWKAFLNDPLNYKSLLRYLFP